MATKITKSELKQMICEALREALNKNKLCETKLRLKENSDTCLICGNPCDANDHIDTLFGLVHDAGCWDEFVDTDEGLADEYYAFAIGESDVFITPYDADTGWIKDAAEAAVNAEAAWKTLRSAGKLPLSATECDEIERKFKTRLGNDTDKINGIRIITIWDGDESDKLIQDFATFEEAAKHYDNVYVNAVEDDYAEEVLYPVLDAMNNKEYDYIDDDGYAVYEQRVSTSVFEALRNSKSVKNTKSELKEMIREALREELASRNVLKEALNNKELKEFANAAEYGHQEYFVTLYHYIKKCLAVRYGVSDYADYDIWNTLANELLGDISQTGDIGRSTFYQDEFFDEVGRNMNKQELAMLNHIFKLIPTFFDVEPDVEDCRVTVFASGADFYELVASGWYSDDISADDCIDAFDAGWNKTGANYYDLADERGKGSDWADALDSCYNSGEASRNWFDMINAL